MKMFDVEVEFKDGAVWIMQDDGAGGMEVITLHPDQVDLVCKWIKQAACAELTMPASELKG